MKKFKIGKTYYMFSPCDHDCTWEYKVIKRTNKTITLMPVDDPKILAENREKVKRVKIQVDSIEEWARPLGKYSMCPILRAGREL